LLLKERQSMASPSSVVRLEIPASGAYLAVARATATGLAAQLHFTYDQLDDLRIAVDEACAQLLARAGGKGATLRVAYHLGEEAGELFVEASVAAPDGASPVARDTFAWQILNAMTDEVNEHLEDGQLRLTLRKRGGHHAPGERTGSGEQ
jgi:serine/threonine-protein kinase RsbW